MAAQGQNGAALRLSVLADQWKGAPEADAPEAVRLLWAGQPEARLFIDAAFQPCPQPQARYRVDLAQVFGPPDGFSRLDLILLDLQTDRVVTELTAGRYQPSAEGGGPS